MSEYLVVSLLGKDRPGLISDLTHAILERGCNIENSRMSVLGDEFAMIFLLKGNWNEIAKIEQALPGIEKRFGLMISMRRTGEREGIKHLLPYAVEVISIDHPGIVHYLANFFSSRTINIEELATNSYAAAHTGAPMFSVSMIVEVSAEIHIAGLREEFMEFCDSYNLDAVIEPIKG